MNKGHSIKVNAVLNIIRSLMGIIFPLISYPYVSRILNPVGLGKVNVASSIISYFVMFAGLGMSSYAVKEGAGYRDDREALGKFSTEIFMINLVSAAFSYLVFLASLCVPALANYKQLLLVSSLTVVFNPLSFEWLYCILEDFTYITIRSIGTQLFSLCLLFIFVKTEQDYVIYALITSIASVGANLLNFTHSFHYIRLFGYKNYTIGKHLKPIFVIFGMSVASQVYLNSDMTMLGLMRGDLWAGYYTAAVKINRILNTMITAVTGVLLPRMSYYVKVGDGEGFQEMIKKVVDFILMLSIPCAVGLLLLSEHLIYLFSGVRFLEGSLASRILAFNIVLSTLNGILAYQILLPHDLELVTLKATVISCIVNVILNIPGIWLFAQNGAAVTTLIAEICVFLFLKGAVNRIVSLKELFRNVKQYLFASVGIVIVYLVTSYVFESRWAVLFITFVCSVAVYGGILLFWKNEWALEIIRELRKRKRT